MKLCKDCKYHSYRWCEAPNNGIDVVDGKARSVLAIVNRKDPMMCGYNAIYFVEKPPFWKFWS